jgi:hypothetical protein
VAVLREADHGNHGSEERTLVSQQSRRSEQLGQGFRMIKPDRDQGGGTEKSRRRSAFLDCPLPIAQKLGHTSPFLMVQRAPLDRSRGEHSVAVF